MQLIENLLVINRKLIFKQGKILHFGVCFVIDLLIQSTDPLQLIFLALVDLLNLFSSADGRHIDLAIMWPLNRQRHFPLPTFHGVVLLLDLHDLILVADFISNIILKQVSILSLIPTVRGLHLSMGPARCNTRLFGTQNIFEVNFPTKCRIRLEATS